LGSEIADKCDLLVGEWASFLPIHVNRADKLALLDHRYSHKGARAYNFDKGYDECVFPNIGLIGPEVRNMDNLFRSVEAVERDTRIIAQLDHRVPL
jgi:hypothetical protein